MGNEASAHSTTPRQNGLQLPSNARLMNTAIKQRLSKGTAKTTYNMKVVIRGDRQTGKSALFHRLEGGGFIREHRVTDQIQCSHVLWPYKTSDEMVNLEIWDVVDKAVVVSHIADDSNGAVPPASMSKNLLPADASTIDVYKGAHAVIFMVDPTRKWTLDYVTGNIAHVPAGIDCVVLFCKKDLHHIWTMSEADIEAFQASQTHANVRTLQISLQDCYGMKELHSFFNVPFLKMKQKSLQQELDRAKREYDQSIVELDILIKHQNYEEFLQRLRSLQDQKQQRKNRISVHSNSHNHGNHSSASAAAAASMPMPAPKVKQTVRSSKDLPLFQEHQQKEERKKKAIQEQKKQALRQQDNLDTFKPSGGLNDDFFADLGDHEEEEDEHDEEDSQDITQKQQHVQEEHPVEMPKAKPIAMRMPSSEFEDSHSTTSEHDIDDEHIHAFIEKVAMDAQVDGNGSEENTNYDDTTENVDDNMNGHSNSPSPEVNTAATETTSSVIEQKEEEEEATVETNIGFADSELAQADNAPTVQPIAQMEDQQVPTVQVQSNPLPNDDEDKTMEHENDAVVGGKLQSLMKVHSAEIEESESDEFDAEPLVFASAPQRIAKLQTKQKQRLTPQPKQQAHSTKLKAIDLGGGGSNANNNTTDVAQQQPIATDDAMDFIMNMQSKKSPSPVGDEEQTREKSKRKRKDKKEKKEKKRKKKKNKHSDDDDEDAQSDSEEKKKRRKNKKKKKKSKDKEKEKDDVLVECEDRDQNQSDNDIVEIE